jgi:V/A-type H+/Na+-transporting ATPase subunit I
VIVKMARIEVAARRADRERLLRTLGRVGAVHMVPVDPAAALPGEEILTEVARARQALQLLSALEPAGARSAMGAREAVGRALSLRERSARREARLARLRRLLEESAGWGDVDPDQLDDLARAGAPVGLWAVADTELGAVDGDVVQPLGRQAGRRVLVAVGGDPARTRVPAGAVAVAHPGRSRHAIMAEAAWLEETLERDRLRLARLAHLVPAIQALLRRLEDEARWSVARNSALEGESLCAFQGWIPRNQARGLAAELALDGVDAGVRWARPGPDDTPPTLLDYPRWARPMRGLFDLLGTTPGYRETDVSGFFMLALPLFAGMIIGDAGYGLIFLVLPLLFRRRIDALVGASRVALLMTFGAAALVWGAVSGVWLGVTPQEMMAAGGVASGLGDQLYRFQLVRGSEEEMRATVIKICFVIGSVHLILAHLRRALAMAPAWQALAEIGWCLVLAGMVGLIWILFFGAVEPLSPLLRPAVAVALLAGLALVVAFMVPHPSLPRRIGLGLAGSLLPLINAFSDTLSYIRLMAVGLASHYIAAAFNTLAFSLSGPPAWIFAVPLLAFGHLLNLALVLLAIFAHGVRLNMLEFSSHAGIQWTGYEYRPFTRLETKEI